MSRNWTQIDCLAVRHLNHYTKLLSVLVWDCNSIIFMYEWFCPIRLIHLIGRKSLHFEKTRMSKSNCHHDTPLQVHVLLSVTAGDWGDKHRSKSFHNQQASHSFRQIFQTFYPFACLSLTIFLLNSDCQTMYTNVANILSVCVTFFFQVVDLFQKYHFWGVLVFLILLKILVSTRYCGFCAR